MSRRSATDEDIRQWCTRRGGSFYDSDSDVSDTARCEFGGSGFISRSDEGVQMVGQIRNQNENKAVTALTFNSDDPSDLRYDTESGKLIMDGDTKL